MMFTALHRFSCPSPDYSWGTCQRVFRLHFRTLANRTASLPSSLLIYDLPTVN